MMVKFGGLFCIAEMECLEITQEIGNAQIDRGIFGLKSGSKDTISYRERR